MIDPQIMYMYDWLAKITGKECRDFRHQRYVSFGNAGQHDHAIVRYKVPDGACWIVTATVLRCFPLLNADFQASDFSSDENFDPVAEKQGDFPYGLGWWEVNGSPITQDDAIFTGVFTCQCLFVFKGGDTVELKLDGQATVPTETRLICTVTAFSGPGDVVPVLASMQTQIISHSDY